LLLFVEYFSRILTIIISLKNAVFWDVAPCRYFVNRCFGGTHGLHLQGIRNPRAMNQREQVAKLPNKHQSKETYMGVKVQLHEFLTSKLDGPIVSVVPW
jgi:hypothetical protein